MSTKRPTKASIFCFVGTRPEYIKTYPVIKALRSVENIESYLVGTSQHQDLLAGLHDFFQIAADYNFDLSRHCERSDSSLLDNVVSEAILSTQLADLSVALLSAATKFLSEHRPDLVMVQGDTQSATQVALAAWYLGIPVAHIEAGLRTYDVTQPYPEELGRRTIDHLAALNFAPTPSAMDNLSNEKVQGRCYLTGNTVVDALNYTLNQLPELETDGKPYILVTAHRRENQAKVIAELATALALSAKDNPDYNFVVIKHANPIANAPLSKLELEVGLDNISFLEPQTYPNFLSLLSKASFVISDSGGIQEEAPYFGVPVLVLRAITERIESLKLGLSKLAGIDAKTISRNINELIQDPLALAEMRLAIKTNPGIYGDGKASARIVKHCLDFLLVSKPNEQQSPLPCR